MHKIVQNLINFLPKKLSYSTYKLIQLKFGRGLKVDYERFLNRSIQLFDYFKKNNINHDAVLELGTGRNITTLIGLKILGVSKIITVDLNPYLDENITKESIIQILSKKNEVFNLFKKYITYDDFQKQISLLEKLLELPLKDLMKKLNIDYYPYTDARKIKFLENNSVDIYFSDQVLEHIPFGTIKEIIHEAKRILKKDGLIFSFIGLHDHFSTIDKSISKINFLKYSDFIWHVLSGNKFMYHNRLRSSEYSKLFIECDLKILDKIERVDKKSLELLDGNFKINRKFEKFEKNDLCVTSMLLVCS